jgi:hypothetical protein
MINLRRKAGAVARGQHANVSDNVVFRRASPARFGFD